MGNNVESGGANRSSFIHNWLFLADATVRINERVVIEEGKLVL
jgi:hypothetical protein